MGTDMKRDFRSLAGDNDAFRREVLTGEHSQLVVMTIQPRSEIGEEIHDVDQILLFVEGEGQAVLHSERDAVGPDDLVFVPAGTRHNFINTGTKPLRLLTVYAPPEHEAGTVHETKEEADAAEA
jgi:mannose-6-phosphate isomerase-like protein (cupin superfamily)